MIDGDAVISYEWLSDTKLVVTAPEDPGNGFDLIGITIYADADLEEGTKAILTLSMDGYTSVSQTVGQVSSETTTYKLSFEVEEPRQVLAGNTTDFDSLWIERTVPFTAGEEITLTLNDGFYFVNSPLYDEVDDNEVTITVQSFSNQEMVILAPANTEYEILLGGLIIGADSSVSVGDNAILKASAENCSIAKDTIATVVSVIVDKVWLDYEKIEIPAGDQASFEDMCIMKYFEFEAGETVTLTLNDGFTFPAGQTLMDGEDTIIAYTLNTDGTQMIITAPEDPGNGFDLTGLTIAADASAEDGDKVNITVTADGCDSYTTVVATVAGAAELDLTVEEPQQILPGATAVFDSMLVESNIPFTAGEEVTLTLEDGFSFVDGMSIYDVGNLITIQSLEDNTLVILAPSDIDGAFGLDGLTIAADTEAEVDTKVHMTVSMDGYTSTTATIATVVSEIVDQVWLDFEEIDLTAGEATAFEEMCIMKYFEFEAGEKVILTLNEGFTFPAGQTFTDENGTVIAYELLSDTQMVITAPEDPGNGFDLIGLTIAAEVGLERRTEAILTVNADDCSETQETVGMVTVEAEDRLYLNVEPVEITAGGQASFEVLGVDKGTEFTVGDKVTLTLSEGFFFIENDDFHDHDRTPIQTDSWSKNEIVVLAPKDPGFGFDLEELTIIADASLTEGTKATMTASMDGYHPVTKKVATVVANETASNPSGTCGENLTWEFDTATGTLTIKGTGDMDADFSTYVPWSDYTEEITSVVIEDGVTRIGSFAFLDCNNLKEVTISDSVTSIGKGAFMSCNALEDITLPDGLTSIGDQIFQGCEVLTEITIPDGMTSIGIYAFCDCYAMTKITIPDDVTSIGEGAFGCCYALTEITIPISVTTIGDAAFWECNALEDVYYGGTETEWNAITIGTNNECLTNATIHYVIPTSGQCGENLTWEFDNTTGTLTISGTGPMYTYDEDDEYEDYSPWLAYKDSITSIVFPDGITEIGYCAFYNHDGLTSVTIPDSVTSIEDYAFASCNNLVTVDLGDGCSLCEGAFNGSPVTELELGASSYFGTQAFTSGLTSITIEADSPSFADGAFWNCSSLKEVHFKGSAPSSVTDKGIMLSNTLSSFRDDVTWYYDCSKDGWLTSDRYDAENKTWAGYTLVSEKHAYEDTIIPPTSTEQGYTIHECPCGESYTDTYTKLTIPAEYYETFKYVYAQKDQFGYISADIFLNDSFAEAYPDLKPVFTTIANDTHGAFTDSRVTNTMQSIYLMPDGDLFYYTKPSPASTEVFDLTISFGNGYEPISVELRFNIVNIIPVNINGLTGVAEYEYDGTAKTGYTGTPVVTRPDTRDELIYTAEDLTYTY
ncbi:leucine-rich repeat domain-containing protein, partial [Anaerotignum sp.]